MDAALRRVEVLDRVFEPRRFARPAPARLPPAVAPPVAAPVADPVAAPVAPAVQPAEPEPPTPAADAETPPLPIAAEAAEAPRPPQDPAARARFLVGQNPWIASFWSELDATRRTRAERNLRARGMLSPDADPAETWDRLGLVERVNALFGPPRGPG